MFQKWYVPDSSVSANSITQTHILLRLEDFYFFYVFLFLIAVRWKSNQLRWVFLFCNFDLLTTYIKDVGNLYFHFFP